LDINSKAKEHWEYTKGILELTTISELSDEQVIDLCGHLYVQAMIHGYKHGKEDGDS